MSRFKEYLKKTALYRRSFCLRYPKERVARFFHRRNFAEYGEDLMVERLLGQPVEFFIDVGANDGFHSSNTFYFALRGARGVCFEPVPEIYSRLRSLHRFNPKVHCLCCGLSDESKNSRMVSLEGLSYLPETQDLHHKRLHDAEYPTVLQVREICLLRFQDAIAGLDVPRIVDLLSVDVEGHELKVLQSIPFDRYRFRAIIVETHQSNGHGQYLWKHRDYEEIFRLLASWGYRPVERTAANTIFLHQRMAPSELEDSPAAAYAGV